METTRKIVRYFPMYNGDIYLADKKDYPIGFVSKDNAVICCGKIPDEDVYAELGGKEQYERDHTFFYGINRQRKMLFYSRATREDYFEHNGDKIYRKDMDPVLFDEAVKTYNELEEKQWAFYNYEDYAKVCADFEKRFGVSPVKVIDINDFANKRMEIRKNKVEIKKAIVTTTIKFVKE